MTSNAVGFRLGCNSELLGPKKLRCWRRSRLGTIQETLTIVTWERPQSVDGSGMLALAKTERKSRSPNRASLTKGCSNQRALDRDVTTGPKAHSLAATAKSASNEHPTRHQAIS